MRQFLGIVMPLVMFKYNSALVDRPTQLINNGHSRYFFCAFKFALSVQFKRRASEVA